VPFIGISEIVTRLPGSAGPSQGEIVQGIWPLHTTSDRPSLTERWDILSIYLPLATTAQPSAAAPTVCNITPQLFLSGELIFQETAQLNYYPISPAPWVGASGSVNASLQNPIAFRSGQTFEARYQFQVDQTCSDFYLVLAGIVDDPSTGQAHPSPGSIGYQIVPELLLTSA
jgi:hypothetical protein